MSLVKRIENKGAVTAWSPLPDHRQLLAVGVKDAGTGGFDDQGGNLEVHFLNFDSASSKESSTSTKLLGSIVAGGRFVSIAWSPLTKKKGEYPYGIIVGGMADGSLSIWDPAKVIQGQGQGKLAVLATHMGSVNSIMFNPHQGSVHLLASGGADGDAYVINLENPEKPTKFPVPGSQAPPNGSGANHKAEITKVAWNSKVAHILATASAGGTCSVWDLKQKRQYCELRDPSKALVADIAWNPTDGLLIMTASGNDAQPTINLWDLRSSVSLPFATLRGHTEGVLSISWCPHDPTFLISCGKDNRTILWDLMKMEACYELPVETAVQSSHGVGGGVDAFGGFGGFAGAGIGQNRRYIISWSPLLRSVISTSSFNRTIEVFSLLGFKSSTGRCPKWLSTSGRVQWAFGGKLLSIQSKESSNGQKKSQITVNKFVQNKELVVAAQKFEHALVQLVSNETIKEYISYKISAAESGQEKETWTFMNLIFDSSGSEALFKELGIEVDAQNKTEPNEAPPPIQQQQQMPISIGMAGNEDDFFSGPAPTVEENTKPNLLSSPPPTQDLSSKKELSNLNVTPLSLVSADTYPEASGKIRRCLLGGNFKGAVDICLEYDLIGEAFLLAKHGGDELWQVATEAFISKEKSKRPLLNLLDAVIKSDMIQLIQSSDLEQWKETLAMLSTYSNPPEFPTLCEALATRLENERLDRAAAATCYMCSHNLEKVVEIWKDDVNNKPEHLISLALQAFVEKVSMMMLAKRQEALPEGITKQFFMKYGLALASQGEVDLAMKYISKAVSGSDQSASILMDRLYHSSSVIQRSFPKPPFPFTEENVASQPYQGTTHTISTGGLDTLPPDWIELVDDNTQRTYYANVVTKKTQWDKPVSLPVTNQTPFSNSTQPTSSSTFSSSKTVNKPSMNSFVPTSSLAVPNKTENEIHPGTTNTSTNMGVNSFANTTKPVKSSNVFVPANSKYNDSFISTVGNPTLGSKYGNHYGNKYTTGVNKFESQPMSNDGMSYGSSSMAGNQTHGQYQPGPEPEPVVEKPPPEPAPELPQIRDDFSKITSYLHGNDRLSNSDRKQLDEVEKALTIVYQKMTIMDLHESIPTLLLQFVQAILNSDLASAQKIHSKFAKDHWDNNKEWIKPIKDILRLIKK